ncbi:hypothetical protein SEUCBS140593_004930 [Sporothrix eucalyptigena]|uniref:Integral membrane protein n=1 Tax=Sporothrix eucalyptigena TaxID=1812306 RepID=A0ABP0BU51_9PEZI
MASIQHQYYAQPFPQQPFLQQPFPQQPFPQQPFPQQSFPQQSFPQQSFPQQSFPQQSFPQQPPPQGFIPLAQVAPSSNTKDVSGKVVSSRGWYVGKIALEWLSVMTGILVIGLNAAMLVMQEAHAVGSGYVDASLGFPAGILAVLWSVSEFVTLCVRRNRGIHPGAHVGMHLIIWGLAAVCASFIAWDCAIDSTYSYWWFASVPTDTADDKRTYALFRRIENALAICMWPLVIVNMILFVRACIECHRRNRNSAAQLKNSQAQAAAASPAAAPAAPATRSPIPPQSVQPAAELDKTGGTPHPQVHHLPSTRNSITPVQSPSHVSPIQGPPSADLSPNTPSQAPAQQFYEIGGTPRYSEMAEIQQQQQRAEMPAPVQRQVSVETDQRRVETPATPQQQHATEAAIVSQPLEAADDLERGQRTGPPQYVMLGGTKVRYHEF